MTQQTILDKLTEGHNPKLTIETQPITLSSDSLSQLLEIVIGHKITIAYVLDAHKQLCTLSMDKVDIIFRILAVEEWAYRKQDCLRLLHKMLLDSLLYRFKMPISEMRIFNDAFYGNTAYYVCPRCGITMERVFQDYCDRCGQALSWKHYKKSKKIYCRSVKDKNCSCGSFSR